MKTYILLLRGINVSGHKKIKMADFKTLLQKEGFYHVRTYIQSGNIVFEYKETDTKKLQQQFEKIIEKHYQFSVACLVISREKLISVFENNPFLPEKSETTKFLHCTFLYEDSGYKNYHFNNEADSFILHKNVLYVYYPNGVSGSAKPNDFLKQLFKIENTTRNWNTVTKLHQMVQEQ
ncbi:DUF1697 domain-containing protein [Zhouia sp. PK063]|uniref:DUF1697 domain-containing protein n=1 Tax=Zhouia sp. PK063 TaxID=3373602 RepID=UPI003794F0DE